jgi:hypothetical protein
MFLRHRSLLFEVEPTDAPTILAITAPLWGVALLASYAPARRATQVDPITVLQSTQPDIVLKKGSLTISGHGRTQTNMDRLRVWGSCRHQGFDPRRCRGIPAQSATTHPCSAQGGEEED